MRCGYSNLEKLDTLSTTILISLDYCHAITIKLHFSLPPCLPSLLLFTVYLLEAPCTSRLADTSPTGGLDSTVLACSYGEICNTLLLHLLLSVLNPPYIL